MSGRAVARGVVMAVAAGLMLGAAAQANEAAHKMAEKFAASTAPIPKAAMYIQPGSDAGGCGT
mgnify:CR=1 FL=1